MIVFILLIKLLMLLSLHCASFSTLHSGRKLFECKNVVKSNLAFKFGQLNNAREFGAYADADTYTIDVNCVHPSLEGVVKRHFQSCARYVKNSITATHTKHSFEEAVQFVDNFYSQQCTTALKEGKAGDQKLTTIQKRVVLDSGCGQGHSTIQLARLYPDQVVIGIDRSFHRLSKSKIYRNSSKPHEAPNNNNKTLVVADSSSSSSSSSHSPVSNMLLVRAELADFWCLTASHADWMITNHYVLYPNPYPKAKHLKRRWHGHPVFPLMLCLGGQLRVRSNWPIYCKEMRNAVQFAFGEYPTGNQNADAFWGDCNNDEEDGSNNNSNCHGAEGSYGEGSSQSTTTATTTSDCGNIHNRKSYYPDWYYPLDVPTCQAYPYHQVLQETRGPPEAFDADSAVLRISTDQQPLSISSPTAAAAAAADNVDEGSDDDIRDTPANHPTRALFEPPAMTLFERKYMAVQVPLYEMSVRFAPLQSQDRQRLVEFINSLS